MFVMFSEFYKTAYKQQKEKEEARKLAEKIASNGTEKEFKTDNGREKVQ